jgi:hypothetical protein
VLCLGCGLISAFYIFYANGLLIGMILIAFGVTLNGIIAWSMVRCSDHYEAHHYEDIALKAFGPKLAAFTICMELLC